MVMRWYLDDAGRAIMETEKMTINIGVVDLGKIDILVEQGFYTNRSDFIRTAIRNQISTHSDEIKSISTEKIIAMGIVGLGRKELELFKAQGKKYSITLAGLLIIFDDVTAELAKETIERVKVYGVIRAPEQVKSILKNKI
jgi:Arc/MetJ-type ribon-helix-helix transcriptional regulator